MTAVTVSSRTSRWGYTSFGHIPALPVAATIGVILAFGLAVLMTLTVDPFPQRVPLWLLFTSFLAVPMTALVWVLVVDPYTIAGCHRVKEKTIEGAWAEHAAKFAFYGLFATLCIGTILAAIFLPATVTFTLMGVLTLASVAYLLGFIDSKIRGGGGYICALGVKAVGCVSKCGRRWSAQCRKFPGSLSGQRFRLMPLC